MFNTPSPKKCRSTYRASKEICHDMVVVAKWGISATGRFFRTLYNGDLWLSRSEAQTAVSSGFDMLESCIKPTCGYCKSVHMLVRACACECVHTAESHGAACPKESFGALARLAKIQDWRLFYMRPKLHMHMHVQLLGFVCAVHFNPVLLIAFGNISGWKWNTNWTMALSGS